MLITCKSQIYYPELTDFAYVFSAVLLKSALFYWLVFKLFIHDTTVLPFFTAAALCLPKIRLLIAAPSYDAFSAGIISIIFTLTLSLLWMNLLRKYASTSS